MTQQTTASPQQESSIAINKDRTLPWLLMGVVGEKESYKTKQREFTTLPQQPPRIQDKACYLCLGHYSNIEKPKFDHDLNAMSFDF